MSKPNENLTHVIEYEALLAENVQLKEALRFYAAAFDSSTEHGLMEPSHDGFVNNPLGSMAKLTLENIQLKHNMLGFDSEVDYQKRIIELEEHVALLTGQCADLDADKANLEGALADLEAHVRESDNRE
jgi:hypothetical protein